MSIHPTLPRMSQQEFLVAARAALGHMFPLNSVRLAGDDTIVLEDDDGREWQLVVYRGT